MELAQKQKYRPLEQDRAQKQKYRPLEQDREPRDKPTKLWVTYF